MLGLSTFYCTRDICRKLKLSRWLAFWERASHLALRMYCIFSVLSVSFSFLSRRGVWVGILNLILSIPGLSVLTLYLMKIHELKVMSAMMGEQTVKASLKTSNNFDQTNMLL